MVFFKKKQTTELFDMKVIHFQPILTSERNANCCLCTALMNLLCKQQVSLFCVYKQVDKQLDKKKQTTSVFQLKKSNCITSFCNPYHYQELSQNIINVNKTTDTTIKIKGLYNIYTHMSLQLTRSSCFLKNTSIWYRYGQPYQYSCYFY